ncbi:hypothetical protein ACWDWT_43925 [Streptomyces sp. NPDC003343]
MQTDRNTLALALIGTAFVGSIAWAHPAAIPALTLALAAFVALAAFLKL